MQKIISRGLGEDHSISVGEYRVLRESRLLGQLQLAEEIFERTVKASTTSYLGPLHLRSHQLLLHLRHRVLHRTVLVLDFNVSLHDTVHFEP